MSCCGYLHPPSAPAAGGGRDADGILHFTTGAHGPTCTGRPSLVLPGSVFILNHNRAGG